MAWWPLSLATIGGLIGLAMFTGSLWPSAAVLFGLVCLWGFFVWLAGKTIRATED